MKNPTSPKPKHQTLPQPTTLRPSRSPRSRGPARMIDEEVEVAEPEADGEQPAPRDYTSLKRAVADGTRVRHVRRVRDGVRGRGRRQLAASAERRPDVRVRHRAADHSLRRHLLPERHQRLGAGRAVPLPRRGDGHVPRRLLVRHLVLRRGRRADPRLRGGPHRDAFGANRDLAVAVGAVVFVHFTLSRSDYAGVLYVRNITTALLAVVWMLLLYDRAWATRTGALVTAIDDGRAARPRRPEPRHDGVQPRPSLALVALGMIRLRRPHDERLRLDIAFVGVGRGGVPERAGLVRAARQLHRVLLAAGGRTRTS